MKKAFIGVAIISTICVLVLGLCFGKVIEETLIAEILKGVFGGAVITTVLEVLTYTFGQFIYDAFIRPKQKDEEDLGMD